jgi:hypothetical protein
MQAEEVSTKMIAENRIKAFVDQVNGVLEFSSGAVPGAWSASCRALATSRMHVSLLRAL